MLNIKIKRNDTFLAMEFEVVINSIQIDLSNYIITLVAKVSDCGEPILTLSTEDDNGMSLVGSVENRFRINDQIFTLKKGIYPYEMTFNDTDADTFFTWVTGNLIVE